MAVHGNPARPRRLKRSADDAFLADALAGLSKPHKELPCKYFYDERGSQLFDAICELNEYYVTRTELSIMRRHVADMAARLGRECLLVEYGAGSGLKTRMLLDHLDAPAGYVPIDISGDYLAHVARGLSARFPHIDVRPVAADFTRPFELPAFPREAARRAVYFPGSTIGNFDPRGVKSLLAGIVELAGPGGGLLIGVDLKKDRAVLEAAYNDADGVTAAFNLNLLERMNRELGADFAVERFRHHAFYSERHGRIEMHLVSEADQTVRLGGREIRFAAGETVHTENSYKFGLDQFRELAAAAGLRVCEVWTDERRYFSVQYLTVA